MFRKTDEQMRIAVSDWIKKLHDETPGSIADQLDFEMISCTGSGREFLFQCKTFDWMRNVYGSLHGGMGATLLDQAMGFVAYCMKPGEGITPTVQMQVEYHRPLIPGKSVLVRVQVVSAGKTLMHLSAQAHQADQPDALCLSATGLYFYKPMKIEPGERKS